ncbi:unnamed protein product [Cylicocyclus nassatus]|uniref:F-actin monooxygenase n=1 Tax=Cylicocyclus nassatus TaxID=53992 RepID=A0AA36H8B4_CYLNA|nr:unnamed protein product [Cylicocyclus nassatus]
MDMGSIFETFVTASTFRSIQNSFYQLCIAADIDPSDSINVYRKLRLIDDWKAQKLFKLLDKKWELAEYKKQTACERLNVFVIGAGPCGLRSAIESALLGSRVVLVEQRERFSRNNVLHLWEFVIQDLKSLGAKIFYPKFCTGSIEHISIRQLQCILLKVALCFGVQIHDSVTFVQLVFPKKEGNHVTGFRASLEPKGHILSEYDIDVIVAADGKRNTIPGFPREEMRGKLAIGITANFVNNKTYAEERVPEISGVAYIFNQAFFKEMYAKTGVDLENIVYYKDDTHYFVMCAKKQSLLDMGVILQDNEDVSQLLSSQNVDQEALCRYAIAAADFATNGKLPSLNFAKNHRGEEDVAMFDFTSLYSSKCSVRLVERMNKYLLMGIVGDSLHEPFWPTGSGCARGFLGVLDTAWLIREYGINKRGPLEMIAERESIYRLLAQVTKDNMNRAISRYTIDPRTRYVHLEMPLQPEDVVQIVSSDNPRMAPIGQALVLNNASSVHANPALRKYSLWKFCHQALSPYKLKLYDLNSCWNDGRALAGLVAKFRPSALDYFNVINMPNVNDRLQAIFNAIRDDMGITPPCSTYQWAHLKPEAKFDYIEKVVHYLRADHGRVKNVMVTVRPHAVQKRKNQKPIMTTTPKRSGSIKRLADNILGCSTFKPSTFAAPVVEDTTLSSAACIRRDDDVDDDFENSDTGPIPRRNSKIVRHYSYRTLREQNDEDAKHYTKRPHVDRLNPDLVQKVERIITGDVAKQQTSEFYAEKNRKAEQFTHKLPKNDIEEMEKRLEHSGMGVLYAKTEHINSQDEKIIRTNAAYARKEAEGGFSNEEKLSRFREYDDKIAKSTEVMKMRDLAGVDPFDKWRQPNPYPAEIVRDNIHKQPNVPPTPPKRTKVVTNHAPDGVVMRPVAPVAPKRHVSAPMMSSLYDSVNARRQETCRLCDKVVYLAERMQVESMYVHKNCFRCAYCTQPLRLGEYGKDKDLEYHYPRKFFCKIHLRVPLKEKIARIERAARMLERNASREQEVVPENGVIEESPITEQPAMPVSSEAPAHSATLSFFSPEQIRDRTVQRMRESVTGPISPVSEIPSADERTPERAEFRNQVRKSSVPSTEANHAAAEVPSNSTSFASEEDEYDDACSSCSLASFDDKDNEGSERPTRERIEDTSASEGEDDGLEEEELEELEKTVLQLNDEDPERPLTDAQVISVINKINERRDSQMTTPRVLSETPDHKAIKEEKFYTPREKFFRNMAGSAVDSHDSAPNANRTNNVEDKFSTPLAVPPEAWDIKKKKAADLERLRVESRMKAKLKTDEELGLAKSGARIHNMPVIKLPKPVSPPARARGMSMTNEPTKSPRVHRSLTVGAYDAPSVVEMPGQSREPEPLEQQQRGRPALPRSRVQGLLTRLFSPDSRRLEPRAGQSKSPSNNADRIHSESRKETSMLGSTFRRFKMKREEHRESPTSSARSSPCTSPNPLVSNVEQDNRDVPCAAVAPSPRFETEVCHSPTHISVNERNIRLFQKRAEKIRRQHDDERRRSAQEIQRGLQECEIRLEEIRCKGQSLEMKLLEDPENGWAMESWFALVHEREVLKCKEEMLRLSKKEMELEVKYRDLNLRFKRLGEGMNDNLAANSELLAAMLAVVEEKKEVNRLSEQAKQAYKKVNPSIQAMREKGRNFQKFKPIFSCM